MKNAQDIVTILYRIQSGIVSDVNSLQVGESECVSRVYRDKILILKGKIELLSKIFEAIKN
jgi:hypothetical protein